jgi:hypothetical protein
MSSSPPLSEISLMLVTLSSAGASALLIRYGVPPTSRRRKIKRKRKTGNPRNEKGWWDVMSRAIGPVLWVLARILDRFLSHR